MPKTPPLVTLAFVTVSIAWGTTYAGIHVAVESLPPLQLAAVRFMLAGAVLLLALRACGIPFPARRDWPRLALVGCLLLTGANSLIGWSSQYLPSVLISLLVNLGPLVYVALARLTGECVHARAWLGLGVGVAGLLVLMAPRLGELGQPTHLTDPHFWPAVGAILLAPFLWSGGSLFAARFPPRCHPLMTAAAQSLAGGIGALVLALFSGEMRALPLVTTRSWLAVAWLVVVGSWLGYVSYIYCVLKLPSARVAVTTYLNTLTALICGWLVLGERLAPATVAGGVIMLLGIALAQSAPTPHPPAADENPQVEA
jgi:drug/metabolite transporter (DMT)-like permease